MRSIELFPAFFFGLKANQLLQLFWLLFSNGDYWTLMIHSSLGSEYGKERQFATTLPSSFRFGNKLDGVDGRAP